LKLGSRYWYYYIVDGYHVSHDPAKEHVVEKTTGRKLNVLNVPAGNKPAAAPAAAPRAAASVKAPSSTVPQGRALSPGRIVHPKPQKPYASRGLREADYEQSPIDDLEDRLAGTRLSDRGGNSSPSELSECSESSGTVFSSSAGSASSATSDSDGDRCRCNRWGVTRDGRRVMLDCGGKRCGYTSSDESSECDTSSEEESSDDEEVETQREAELRRRARAQLEAERARNGVKAAPKPAPKSAPAKAAPKAAAPAARSRHAPAAAVERRRK